MKKKPSVLKILGKLCLVFLFGGIWILTGIMIVKMQFEEGTDYYNSEAYYVNSCDKYYYEKKYDELFEYMHLYDTYGEKYDVYWEVLNAYLDLQEYLKWKKVPETIVFDAREMEKLYSDKVMYAKDHCRFSQNQTYLDDFAKMLKQ